VEKIMSKESDLKDTITETELNREFEFDKFVKDLERREQARRDAAQRLPSDHNAANRLRDARNREQLHNRIRWSR